MSTTDGTRPAPAVVTPALLRDWALPAPGSGKNDRGQVLVVGGTERTPGAVALAAEASLRVGAGKLTVAAPAGAATALAVLLPESLTMPLPTDDDGNLAAAGADPVAELAGSCDAVLVGPGFADPDSSERLLAELVPRLDGPLVLDALASAFVSSHPEGLHHLDERAVLTVNPSELAHLADCDAGDVEDDALGPAVAVARRSRVVVLVGAAAKHVVTPGGDAWVVQGGGPGLGVSGSGDTQAGIVAGLLARGADPVQAAVWGAYLHARAGERLGAAVGVLGYLAREIPPQLPLVLTEIG